MGFEGYFFAAGGGAPAAGNLLLDEAGRIW